MAPPPRLRLVPPDDADEPNPELIRPTGWSVQSIHGEYVVAWRGPDEVVLRWRAGGWVQVAGRGEFRAAG
jgi:hypothetical protein